jgi:phage gp36-like protein
MSTYAIQADILGEIQTADLISLTDDDSPPTGDINIEVLNAAIENASGVVDRYVGNLYAVPFDPVPPSVRSLTVTICCYKLYRRRLVPNEKNNFTEDYLAAIKFLEAVNSGDKMLDLTVVRDFSQVAANTLTTPWGSGNVVVSSK